MVYESIGGSAAVANASNAQGRSSIVQGWDQRSPTGETFLREKESRRSFGMATILCFMRQNIENSKNMIVVISMDSTHPCQ